MLLMQERIFHKGIPAYAVPGIPLRGIRVTVLGAARSGRAVARLLKGEGAVVFVSDAAPEENMQAAAAELEAMDIPHEFGEHSGKVLDADFLVLSPGVPTAAPPVQQALARNMRVVSELEVASWFCPGPIVAISGTNGKTTTTTLAGRMFEDAKKPAIVAGNIGTAFSQVVAELTEKTTTILEVSSFQLDHIERFKPQIAVLLNITPDHLDRYDHSLEKYIAAKFRVFENQRGGDVLIYNHDDEIIREGVERAASGLVKRLPFSLREQLSEGAFLDKGRLVSSINGEISEIIPTDSITIRGMHNLYNAMAATLVGKMLGIHSSSLRATLKSFKGVEHRLEFVREYRGISFVNDSKGTNVDSVWYALQSFSAPIVLMLGGRDKGNEYSRLSDLVQKHVRAIVAIGESAPKVVSAFDAVVPVTTASSMQDAVQKGMALAAPGDVVLLSPACASFDWFDNYEHRGRVFKQCVSALGETE